MEWKAIYTDGTELPQFNEDGSENKYGDIDRAKLKEFHLVQHKQIMAVVHLDSKKRLIYRRRVAQYMAGPKKGLREAVYLVGWQEKRGRVNVQVVCFVFEDGHIEVLDRFREDHPWFYSVNFLLEERL